MSQYIVEKSTRIKAAPAQVWAALTDPDRTEKFFFHARVISDWQPGSTITFRGRMLLIIPFEMSGRIVEIQPGRSVTYTLQNGKGAQSSTSTVTVLLAYENGRTLVSITDDVGDGAGAERRLARSQKGWDKILSGLRDEVEQTSEVA